MTRQESNLELLIILGRLIVDNPDLRFSQILYSFGFVKPARAVKEPGEQMWQNEFYLESSQILERVERRVEDVENDS